MAEIRNALDRDAIITFDCGISQIWASQLYQAYVPRSFLITGRTGTMGWGLGAALGAKVAFPDRHVINLLGDASLGMSLQELATAAKHNIPVVVIVMNNSHHAAREEEDIMKILHEALPKIGHIQIADYPGRHQPGTGNINYERFFTTLNEMKYSKAVAMEYIPEPDTVTSLKWVKDFA